jgi:hypothetical protein
MQEFLLKAGMKIPDMKDGIVTDGMTKALQAYMDSKGLKDQGALWKQVLGGTADSAQKVDVQPAANKGLRPEVLALAKANGIKDPNVIKVGQKIKLPNGTFAVVDKGDTLNSLYDRYKAGGYDEGTPVEPTTASAPPTVSASPVVVAKGASPISTGPASAVSSGSDAKQSDVPPVNSKPDVVSAYLNKLFPKATQGQQYWVNGQLYSAKVIYKGNIRQRDKWFPDEKFFASSDVNKSRVNNKYTGPDEGNDAGIPPGGFPNKDPRGNPLIKDKNGNLGYYNNPAVPNKGFTIVVPAKYATATNEGIGFANEDLSRIVSLVHYR